MSEIQPEDLFSDTYIQETSKLRYKRALDEPKTKCTRCDAELILSRLPWQSRCLKCKEAWTGAVCTSETGTSVGCSFELSASSPSVSDSGLSTCSGAWPTSSGAV